MAANLHGAISILPCLLHFNQVASCTIRESASHTANSPTQPLIVGRSPATFFATQRTVTSRKILVPVFSFDNSQSLSLYTSSSCLPIFLSFVSKLVLRQFPVPQPVPGLNMCFFGLRKDLLVSHVTRQASYLYCSRGYTSSRGTERMQFFFTFTSSYIIYVRGFVQDYVQKCCLLNNVWEVDLVFTTSSTVWRADQVWLQHTCRRRTLKQEFTFFVSNNSSRAHVHFSCWVDKLESSQQSEVKVDLQSVHFFPSFNLAIFFLYGVGKSQHLSSLSQHFFGKSIFVLQVDKKTSFRRFWDVLMTVKWLTDWLTFQNSGGKKKL